MHVSRFMRRHYKHFNAAVVVDAADAYAKAVDDGAQMLVTLAGAMSTAELGKSLAEMIRAGKVHAISCTGANLEEDLYNLLAHTQYRRVPHYRELSPAQEAELRDEGLPRVTDTCIPEEAAMRKLERHLIPRWEQADRDGEPKFPHEFLYDIIRAGELDADYDNDPADSWLLAAAEKNLPIWTPGWEDSTSGNMLAACVIRGSLSSTRCVKSGLDAMVDLTAWYRERANDARAPGFFQIGGGIAGDFPICVVPMIQLDLKQEVPYWSYFCQISDSTTSYGSYSGATPNEKITWGKLDVDTPRFIIESDATIVAPLVFAQLLGW